MSQLDFLEHPPKPTSRKGLSWGAWVLLAGIVAVAFVLAIQLTRQNTVQPRTGEVAPSFELTTFDGQTLTLESLRGQIVLVNFWGSWCAPCHDEAPELEEAYNDYKERGLIVVGVNWLDTATGAADFIERYDITYPNGADTRERIAKAYHIQGAPENFLIGRDGKIIMAWLSPVTYPMLADALDAYLEAEGA
jgi:cytochrome c biogenesis protein CcmG, thiol:disulfide interchange protein DsbE